MPITTTAKRALRSSKRKQAVNKILMTKLDIAMRMAKKTPSLKNIVSVQSLADKATKKKILHKNKVSRIKSQASSLLPQRGASSKSLKK